MLNWSLCTGHEKGWHGWRAYRPCITTSNQSTGAEDATFGMMVLSEEIYYLAKTRGSFCSKKAHPRLPCCQLVIGASKASSILIALTITITIAENITSLSTHPVPISSSPPLLSCVPVYCCVAFIKISDAGDNGSRGRGSSCGFAWIRRRGVN